MPNTISNNDEIFQKTFGPIGYSYNATICLFKLVVCLVFHCIDDHIPKTVYGVGELKETCCYRPYESRISNYTVYMMYYHIFAFDML